MYSVLVAQISFRIYVDWWITDFCSTGVITSFSLSQYKINQKLIRVQSTTDISNEFKNLMFMCMSYGMELPKPFRIRRYCRKSAGFSTVATDPAITYTLLAVRLYICLMFKEGLLFLTVALVFPHFLKL